MSETKWTPGPWAVKPKDNDIFDAAGELLACAYPMSGDGAKSYRTAFRNARLIAAAPGTYTAAENFANEAEAVIAGELGQDWADNYGPLFERLCELRAALAKARGEA